MNEQLFALDIGTRSVVGLLMERDEDQYKLVDYYMMEHQERSMLDGQIHNIVSVSKVIQQVKLHLENQHNTVLHSVCVAAAGRALKTKRIISAKDITQQPLMNQEDILFLELEAVQKAQYQLATTEEDASMDYYCVGYSVIQYSLDGETIGSLIDQQGEQAEVEIIATFLPKVVVESLLSALQRADLELEALTLEPIAAIHVLMPPSMRRLNVALVDIGAGTSDIALTSEGTVTAYGMVPKAGDEITEAISDQYLLDFNQAEDFKKEITLHKKATVSDILGFEQTIEYPDFIEQVAPAVDTLAGSIAEEITELNGTPPKAVMLVGGGSQTPELAKRLAIKLNLPANRVAIRGVDAIPFLSKQDNLPIGPEFITPIGIAIAAKQNPVHYISVTVNHRIIRLFEMKTLTVADCLLAAGINVKKLYGKPGMAAMVEYNDKAVTLPGTFGLAPTIQLNGENANVDDTIHNGDTLLIEKGNDGKHALMTVGEFIGELHTITVFYNQNTYQVNASLTINGRSAKMDTLLNDGDKIAYRSQITVADFLQQFQLDKNIHQDFTVWVDDQKLVLADFSKSLQLNNVQARLDQTLKNGDQLIEYSISEPTVDDLISKLEVQAYRELIITYNHKPLTLRKELVSVYRHGEVLAFDDVIHDQDKLQIKKLSTDPFIFQDIFRFISLDLSQAKGRVELIRNGNPATFFEELQPNDQIEIIL
ncbi:pilus assembly protein PilM [Gracilibacillus caseinilyticus]|uniref:Pilus assembly protein PilM n=1 Tax=Gracilibacillus caseinilyticus TaxID=2932256 RepID=A0ABY4EU03_9BACI|nr:pilus assembly protein PilM [Gracilibacillus caseinilyticus]UOQ47114.1 pilus assembly protein PilM [Gracilibacillus caseinilyticus]